MIFTESTIKISNNVSKMDSTIVLYRGDKNVEIRFTILQSPFKYSNTVATNVIESTNASYGQLVIKTPNDKPPIFSEVSATKEGTVLFTITKEMIDEIEELGVYTFQIRLMDENKQSRVTIPPVENGIEIKEPIAIEDDNTTNVVGLAKANYAVATLSDVNTPAFDDNGQYIKTNWNDGDVITNASLNKIEEGIYTTNENVTATKKYVDDKITVKILPVDYNKNCATNVADLEPHSIYMSPNDAKFLYLGYEKLSGDFSGFFISGNPHGKFIYTGTKDDTKIEVILEGICHTAYFKTDTVDPHTEKTVFYLTKNNTTEFTPSNDYEPATKKYVDDNRIGYIKSETVGETIDTSTMINSFNNNSYIYESNNVTYLEMGKEYHVIVNGVRYRALCINNMTGNDQIYETIIVTGDGFSISIMNKMGYNTKYYTDNTKCAYEIKLSDELLAAPPTIQILKMDIEYIPTYLMPKDLEILNSISINRIGDIGTGSAAIGYKNTASNDFTFAMGVQTTASAPGAHAEGGLTVANASYSHAEGFKSASTGEYSHVEGIVCESSGQGSHAEGYYTVASGQRSHSEGCFTEAASQYQHVQGKYNVVDSNGVYAHIVGNGTGKNNRHNAHTLDWEGNAWFAGKLTQEGTPTEGKDLTTKKYVDDNILLEQLPILRIDETNKRIYVNCNNMGTYKKYFVPNKYANVYGFSFIYTNEDSSETEIALIGGAMTRDDFILCTRNTNTLFILILGDTDKYTYTKSTKTLEKSLYGYLKIGNTQEYVPTENYNPATKKYVDDNKIAYTISSKVLTTIPANNIVIDNEITINNASINKNRRYYIEFLGSKKLCTLLVSEEIGNCIICNIGGYIIQAFNNSTNIMLLIELGKNDITTVTFTDLVIYEEEVKYLDNKYLETDLLLQNSISLGRIGDIGAGSSAIGMRAEASGQCSHAEGMYVTSSGNYSHAEGNLTKATGDGSHAEGGGTIASGNCSHAEGNLTRASSEYQHVQGKYNIEDTANKYAHIVGNGTDDNNRSNAHTLDWQGNAWYSGKVTTGAAPVEDMDLTTKKYVDDKVTSLPQLSFNEAGELVVTINGVSKTFVPKNV